TSPDVIQLLELLSLRTILWRNKQIEAANDAGSVNTLKPLFEPCSRESNSRCTICHFRAAEVGSETTSLINIEPEDFARLRLPS
ncbi:hypothetical protein B0H34DRAFT_637448, partial [Crassisporium funariophilum]